MIERHLQSSQEKQTPRIAGKVTCDTSDWLFRFPGSLSPNLKRTEPGLNKL